MNKYCQEKITFRNVCHAIRVDNRENKTIRKVYRVHTNDKTLVYNGESQLGYYIFFLKTY